MCSLDYFAYLGVHRQACPVDETLQAVRDQIVLHIGQIALRGDVLDCEGKQRVMHFNKQYGLTGTQP